MRDRRSRTRGSDVKPGLGISFDLIAQTGHFKLNAGSLQNDFVVEGEGHYWVHVTIDRFTGQVIDKQIEVVNE